MLTIQVIASLALVAAVLWGMWRLPGDPDRFAGWAPPLALFSPWAGLASIAATVVLWFLESPDGWLVPVFLGFYPGAIATGTLVLWIYRKQEEPNDTILAQRLQAKVGITLGMFAVVLGYIFVMTNKTPFTPIGQ